MTFTKVKLISLFLLVQVPLVVANPAHPTFEELMQQPSLLTQDQQETWAQRTYAWIASVLHDMHSSADTTKNFSQAFRRELTAAKSFIIRGTKLIATASYDYQLNLNGLPPLTLEEITVLEHYLTGLHKDEYRYLLALASITNSTPEKIVFDVYQRKNGNLGSVDSVMMSYALYHTSQDNLSATQQKTLATLRNIAQQQRTFERKHKKNW